MTAKALIAFLALVLAALAARAQVNYAVSGNMAYVTNSLSVSGSIVIASSYEGHPVTSIGYCAFLGCVSLTNVTIPDSVMNVGDLAFAVCTNLTSITIPDNATNIGNSSFSSDYSLTNVTMGTNLMNIGGSAFENCSSLTSITIPNGVKYISGSAFWDCFSLTNVVIGNNVLIIGPGAFYDCSGLTSITIPDSVTSVGLNAGLPIRGAFGNCSSLTNVIIGNGVQSINPSTFIDCTSLRSVVIPSSVTNIGSFAFYNCTDLASIVIGSNVTSINDDAFETCSNLISVTFLGNAPTADSTIFFSGTNVTVYYAPNTTGWDNFASTVGAVTAPQFGSTAYGGLPTLFYPPSGTNNTLQMSTNSASGNWITVSNAVALAAVQLTNVTDAAYFRLQGSGGSVPSPGLSSYFGQLVLFYPTNGYALQTATRLDAPNWISAVPGGNTFLAWQITNAPPGAVFRLH